MFHKDVDGTKVFLSVSDYGVQLIRQSNRQIACQSHYTEGHKFWSRLVDFDKRKHSNIETLKRLKLIRVDFSEWGSKWSYIYDRVHAT